jgi:hypothetical protein
MTPKTLGCKQELFARYVVKLLAKIHELGWEARLGEVFRPQEMQDLYVRTGRSKATHSYHQDKLAIDLAFITCDGKEISDAQKKSLGEYWESLDPLNSWGGFFAFVDKPHFSYGGERKR